MSHSISTDYLSLMCVSAAEWRAANFCLNPSESDPSPRVFWFLWPNPDPLPFPWHTWFVLLSPDFRHIQRKRNTEPSQREESSDSGFGLSPAHQVPMSLNAAVLGLMALCRTPSITSKSKDKYQWEKKQRRHVGRCGIMEERSVTVPVLRGLSLNLMCLFSVSQGQWNVCVAYDLDHTHTHTHSISTMWADHLKVYTALKYVLFTL